MQTRKTVMRRFGQAVLNALVKGISWIIAKAIWGGSALPRGFTVLVLSGSVIYYFLYASHLRYVTALVTIGIVIWMVRSIRQKVLSRKPRKYEYTKDDRTFLANCVGIFVTASYLPNIIPIIIGLIGQFWLAFHIDHRESSNENLALYFIYSLLFMIYWAPPLVKGLSSLDELYEKAFYTKVVRRLHRLDNHYIVGGYGRFGKTVIHDFIESYLTEDDDSENSRIYSECNKPPIYGRRESERRRDKKEPGLWFERMLSNKYEEVLYCSNMLIIETDEHLFDISFEDPIFGKVGVAVISLTNLEQMGFRCPKDIKEKYEQIFIPAIIGDISNKAIMDLSALQKAKIVLSLTPGLPLTQQLFDTVARSFKESKKAALITTSNTNEIFYFIPKSHNTNIDFLHGVRIRGYEIGDVVCTNYKRTMSQALPEKPQCKILILGSGRQLHFVLERLWLELGGLKQQQFFRENILVVGIDEYIKKSLIYCKEKINEQDRTLKYWNHRISHERQEHSLLVPYLEGYPYSYSLIAPLILNENSLRTSEVFSSVHPGALGPYNIIVVSSNDAKEILKILHVINRTICFSSQLPITITESSRIIRDNVLNVIDYYSAVNNPNPQALLKEPYPVRFSENIIDSFEQACKEVRGYEDAVCREDAAILKICVKDNAGTLEELLFFLTALSEDSNRNTSTQGETKKEIPSFHNSLCAAHGDFFCFFFYGELVEYKPTPIAYDPKNIHSVFVVSKSLDTRQRLAGEKYSLIPKPVTPWDCPDLTSCANCAIRHAIKSGGPDKGSMETSFSEKPPFERTTLVGEARKLSARVYACCFGHETPGSFAMVVRKLMLKSETNSIKQWVDEKRERPLEDGKIIDIKFMRGVDCFNPQCEHLHMYGNLVKEKLTTNGLNQTFQNCLKGVIINTVGSNEEKGGWNKYSSELTRVWGSNCKGYHHEDSILLIEEEYKDALVLEGFYEYLLHISNTKSQLDPQTLATLTLLDEYGSILKSSFITGLKNKCAGGSPISKLEEILKWVEGILRDAKKEQNRQSLCPIPITRCPFKSQALYLLKKRTLVMS